MEYCIAQGISSSSLAKEVQRLIGEGWIPNGGIAIAKSAAGYDLYSQPMTRQASPAVDLVWKRPAKPLSPV